MNLEEIKSKLVNNVYHINKDKEVALHKHDNHDEIFYCLKGEGYGVLENDLIFLELGKAFIVPAGTMHSLKTDSDLYVTSFLIPVIK